MAKCVSRFILYTNLAPYIYIYIYPNNASHHNNLECKILGIIITHQNINRLVWQYNTTCYYKSMQTILLCLDWCLSSCVMSTIIYYCFSWYFSWCPSLWYGGPVKFERTIPPYTIMHGITIFLFIVMKINSDLTIQLQP